MSSRSTVSVKHTAVHVPLWFHIPAEGSFSVLADGRRVEVVLESIPGEPHPLEALHRSARPATTASIRTAHDPYARQRLTIARLIYPGTLSFPPNRRKRLDAELRKVAAVLNSILDAVRYCTGEFQLPRISPYDLALLGFAPVSPATPTAEMAFLVDYKWGVTVAEDDCHTVAEEAVQQLREFLQSGRHVPLEIGQLLDAYASHRGGQNPRAVVEAVTSLEIVLAAFLRKWLADPPDRVTKILREINADAEMIRLGDASAILRSCGVSRVLGATRRLLGGIKIQGLDAGQIFGGAAQAIRTRNRIVHEGLRRLRDRDVLSWLSNISILIGVLKSASFEFGVRIPLATLTRDGGISFGYTESKPIMRR